VPIPLEGFLWNFILGMFTNICRHILILVKHDRKKTTFSRKPAYIIAVSWVVFLIETGCDLFELWAGAGGKRECQNITFGHD
jgi:hypothetical protein